MNYFEIILKLVQLAPSLLKMIHDVEAIIGSGNGESKKVIVMAPLATAAPELQTAASKMVDTMVAHSFGNPARPTLVK